MTLMVCVDINSNVFLFTCKDKDFNIKGMIKKESSENKERKDGHVKKY